MKKTVFFLFCFAFLAFGQMGGNRQQMSREMSAQAWAAVDINLPENTPPVSGGGLHVESETNGTGKKVWMIQSQTGTYLLRWKTCRGEYIKMEESYWEYLPSNGYVSTGLVFDSVMLSALPFFPQVCRVEMIHLEKGSVRLSWVNVNPWQSAPTPKITINESVGQDGRYQLSTGKLPEGAVVILGRYTLGLVKTTPFGTTITFPEGMSLPPAGPTTFTVCSVEGCNTTTFERKLSLEPSGKG